MGGDLYARPIVTTSSSTGASQASRTALSQRTIHADCNPKNKVLTAITTQPIIICFDVTGSMGDWPRVIYDKLPMFFGQIMAKGYLSDASISFMAVGDRNATLQASSFATGIEIDTELKKIWLAGRGRGSPENYEFAADFIKNQTDFKAADIKPFFFLIGDAKYFPSISASEYKRVFGGNPQGDVDSKELWQAVKEKCNVFYMHKFYSNSTADEASMAQWTATLGADHIMRLDNAKACVDAMLGVVSIVSGSRTQQTYLDDMEARGQDDARIKQITSCLTSCAPAIQTAKLEANIQQEDADELA